MERRKMQEMGKSRVTQIKMADVCNGTVIGIFSIWVVWLASSLLISIWQ